MRLKQSVQQASLKPNTGKCFFALRWIFLTYSNAAFTCAAGMGIWETLSRCCLNLMKNMREFLLMANVPDGKRKIGQKEQQLQLQQQGGPVEKT